MVRAATLLGLNVWLAGVLWPLLATGERALAAYVAAAACLLPLAAGAAAYLRVGRDGERDEAADLRARTVAGAAWLVAFPIACGAVMAAWPHASERALGTSGLVLLWLSLCAYAAAVARACGVHAQAPLAPELSFDSTAPALRGGAGSQAAAGSVAPPPRRLRTAVIALCSAGGAVLALLAPDLGALAPDADGATRAAQVLTAVVGSALGCTVVAVFLASALRADAKPSDPRLDSNLRAAWFVFVALLGAVVYYVVQP